MFVDLPFRTVAQKAKSPKTVVPSFECAICILASCNIVVK